MTLLNPICRPLYTDVVMAQSSGLRPDLQGHLLPLPPALHCSRVPEMVSLFWRARECPLHDSQHFPGYFVVRSGAEINSHIVQVGLELAVVIKAAHDLKKPPAPPTQVH